MELSVEEMELEQSEFLPTREVMCCPSPCYSPCGPSVYLSVNICVNLGCI